jgi:hypothetical protein
LPHGTTQIPDGKKKTFQLTNGEKKKKNIISFPLNRMFNSVRSIWEAVIIFNLIHKEMDFYKKALQML